MQPLYKYRPVTRVLETRDYSRHSVIKVSLREKTDSSLIFDAVSAGKLYAMISSSDSDMVNYKKKFAEGNQSQGTLQIDIVSDDVIRVRYAEGRQVPVNDTPMLANPSWTGPRKCKISEHKQFVSIRTTKIEVRIE